MLDILVIQNAISLHLPHFFFFFFLQKMNRLCVKVYVTLKNVTRKLASFFVTDCFENKLLFFKGVFINANFIKMTYYYFIYCCVIPSTSKMA